MGWHNKEGRKEINKVEESIFIIWMKIHSYSSYLCNVSIPYTAEGWEETGQTQKGFSLASCKENKGYKLVKWEVTMKYLGRLGIKNLRRQNDSLLMKWLWRCSEEDQALWKEIIKVKYGENNRWCSNTTSTPYGSGACRTIRDILPKIEKHMTIKVGDGRKTKSWEMLGTIRNAEGYLS